MFRTKRKLPYVAGVTGVSRSWRIIATLVVALVGGAACAHAAPKSQAATPPAAPKSQAATPPAAPQWGYDVSYPQCGRTAYPPAQFTIVGVTAGRAGTVNPCLADQLSWAATTLGVPGKPVPRLSLYLVGANPGPQVESWPRSGDTSFGACDGRWSPACAFLYGEHRAEQAFAAAAAAAPRAGVAQAPWWIDVETATSWSRDDLPLNRAAILGFLRGLRSSGVSADIGVYSTPNDWRAISGGPGSDELEQIPEWVAGAGTPDAARARCGVPGFATGRVAVAQFPDGDLDGDVACDGVG